MIAWDHPLVQFAWLVATLLLALMVVLAGFVLARRALRLAGSRGSMGAAAEVATIVEHLVRGTFDYHTGLQVLLGHRGRLDRTLPRYLATAHTDAHPERLVIIRRLCHDLGLVDTWRRQLARQTSGWTPFRLIQRGLRPVERVPGLSFVARAEAAEHLGLIRDHGSWPLLTDALDDPHLAVRSAAARALAHLQAPESFVALSRKLESAAMGNGRTLSVRVLRMSLAAFPPDCAIHLVDLLLSPHRRVRFLAADVIATMVQPSSDSGQPGRASSAALPQPVAEIFLTQLRIDENPDVRARAADVISHLADPRAATSLVTMLDDTEWFVRLHVVRALTRLSPVPIEPLRRCLTDSNWHVREAGVGALAGQGIHGLKLLLHHFVNTQDRYSREQVAEQIERMGLIPSVLAAFGVPGAEHETAFVKGIIHLGRTAALATALQNGMRHKSKVLLHELRGQQDSPTAAFVRILLQMPQRSDPETPAAIVAAERS